LACDFTLKTAAANVTGFLMQCGAFWIRVAAWCLHVGTISDTSCSGLQILEMLSAHFHRLLKYCHRLGKFCRDYSDFYPQKKGAALKSIFPLILSQ
jgi:hypothetical protein